MNEYDRMKAQKEDILSRELQVICSSCGATCIYKREKNRVVFIHSCTPPQVRERIVKLRKIAWPWIPARQGQITFDEWSDLVRWVTDSELEISEAREMKAKTKLPSLRIFKGGIDRVFPTDAEGNSLCHRMSDLRSRWFLIHLSEQLYDEGQKQGAGLLMNAYLYLDDRLAYELYRDAGRASGRACPTSGEVL